MSHQRHLSTHDAIKEPHSISLKVLRLSRPSLVTQYPVKSPLASSTLQAPPIPASLAYTGGSTSSPISPPTNPDPFLLSPIVNLPPSFGSAYVGEHFSCTLCANNEFPAEPAGAARKQIRDVKIEAEMKTPGSSGGVHKLELAGADIPSTPTPGGVDLAPGETMQRVVGFDLKDEGNHVLAVTVSYYEATETSGRTRTFRKLYQFICKSSLIVRTKVGEMPATPENEGEEAASADSSRTRQRWVLEAQLENCSEDVMQLESVVLNLEPGLAYTDCNWADGGGEKPVLHPGEVQQVCFLVEETPGSDGLKPDEDGRTIFGVLGIGWRGEMGNRGYLSTGRLGTRVAAGP
ncbi:hypothetical protein F5X68DRAFT_174136 [Plectosphaerella plurivora]|uniref:Trafficking protein particle complex subunit 13 n=1 Tax=Plectosphaerella plurivora TaxID=936078 RepID=A0A9P8V4N6_9PEZI|nr:hypothetical protein F5X68DRAFT_174136 [Plectosphaerella plurivora]